MCEVPLLPLLRVFLAYGIILRLKLRDLTLLPCVYFQCGKKLLLETRVLFKIGERVENFHPFMKLIQPFKVFW